MRRVVFVTVVLMALVAGASACARPGTPASPPAPSDGLKISTTGHML